MPEPQSVQMIRCGNPCGWCGATEPHRHKSGCYEYDLNALQQRVEALEKALQAVRDEEMAFRATDCFCVSWQGGGEHHPVCQQAMAALRNHGAG